MEHELPRRAGQHKATRPYNPCCSDFLYGLGANLHLPADATKGTRTLRLDNAKDLVTGRSGGNSPV